MTYNDKMIVIISLGFEESNNDNKCVGRTGNLVE